MPSYSFKCDQCGCDRSISMPISEYVSELRCDVACGHFDCTGTLRRTFAGQAPAISKVPGAGGSPGRTTI